MLRPLAPPLCQTHRDRRPIWYGWWGSDSWSRLSRGMSTWLLVPIGIPCRWPTGRTCASALGPVESLYYQPTPSPGHCCQSGHCRICTDPT